MSRSSTLTALIALAARELKDNPSPPPFLAEKRVFELSEVDQPAPSGVSIDYLRLLRSVRRNESPALAGLPIAARLFRLLESEINDSLMSAMIIEEELFSVALET